jgi:hypothetical protein
MKNVLIYNSQAAGDCLLGTHTARLYKKQFPDSNIYFCTRYGLVPTTAESENETAELLELIGIQEHIAGVGQIVNTTQGPAVQLVGENKEPIKFDEVIEQHGWYSDLGIVCSQSASLFEKYDFVVFSDTETRFNVDSEKTLPTDHIVIGMPGPLDWNRKTKNEALRISFLTKLKYYLEQNKIPAKIMLLGRDVETGSLLQSMQKLNNCHIFIGPMGLPIHFAAGLGVDTINISSVLPKEYDSPEFYHSGWHRSAKSNLHCGTYACVTPKTFPDTSHEGPKTEWGFWPKKCPLTENGFSCVYNTSPDLLVSYFADWYVEKGKYLCNR